VAKLLGDNMDLGILKNNFKKNNGILKASQIIELGFTRTEIHTFVSENIIESIYHGYYKLYNFDISDVIYIKTLLPDAIICMDSALFHYGYIDRTPLEWHVAVSKNTSKSKFKGDYSYLRPYFLRDTTLNIGKTAELIDGIEMNIYERERVICDCFRFKKVIDSETYTKAINSYIKDGNKNITNLVSYAKQLRVYEKLSAVMEVIINA